MDTLTENLRTLAPASGKRLDQPCFELAGRVHDWRNYVPKNLQEAWASLTERERLIIAVMADEQASAEEWD